MSKLKGSTIEELAKNYGKGAVINNANGITLSSTSLSDFGNDPAAIGRLFGLSANKQTKPFAGENGVGVLKMLNFIPAPESKDFSPQKESLNQKAQSKGAYFINEAIKEISKTKDSRVKYF
jgi:peptidyl-prolyl cis-trans isomerase D